MNKIEISMKLMFYRAFERLTNDIRIQFYNENSSRHTNNKCDKLDSFPKHSHISHPLCLKYSQQDSYLKKDSQQD